MSIGWKTLFNLGMDQKMKILLFATIASILFTTLAYVSLDYQGLWLNLQALILPVIYIAGYEMIMKKMERREQEMELSKRVLDSKFKEVEAELSTGL